MPTSAPEPRAGATGEKVLEVGTAAFLPIGAAECFSKLMDFYSHDITVR